MQNKQNRKKGVYEKPFNHYLINTVNCHECDICLYGKRHHGTKEL